MTRLFAGRVACFVWPAFLPAEETEDTLFALIYRHHRPDRSAAIDLVDFGTGGSQCRLPLRTVMGASAIAI